MVLRQAMITERPIMKRLIILFALLVVACGPRAPREGSIEHFAEQTRQAVINHDVEFFRTHLVSEAHFDGGDFAPMVEAWLYDPDYLAARENDDRFTSVASILVHPDVSITTIDNFRNFNEDGLRTHLIVYFTEEEFYDHHPIYGYMSGFAVVEVVRLNDEWVFIDPLFATLPGHHIRSEYE
jgi:hypothetical protein